MVNETRYSLKISKHFVVFRVLLSALDINFDDRDDREMSKVEIIIQKIKGICVFLSKVLGNLIACGGGVLAILLTVRIFASPATHLSLFILELIFPIRLCITIYKAFCSCSNKNAMIKVLTDTTKNTEYPLILREEIESYKNDIDKYPWLLIILAIASFLQNLPSLIVAKIYQDAEQKKELLIKIWLPSQFEPDDWMIDAINVSIVVIVYSLGYIVYGFASFHISLIILSEKMFQHLNRVLLLAQSKSNAQDPDNQFSEAEMNDVLKYAIQQHQRCIRFIDQINAIFSTILLLDTWSFLYALCAVSYHFVKAPNILPVAIRTLIQNVITTALYLGLSCWHADTATSEGLLVSKNCMSICWLNYGPSLAQDISIMSSMAQMKLSFMVGPFYSLNMVTFLALLEIGLTYFLLLYQIS